MPAKKKATKKAPNGELPQPTKIESKEDAPFAVEGPVFHDGFTHLSPNDLLRLDLLLEKSISKKNEQRALTGDVERIKAQAQRDIDALQRQQVVVASQLMHSNKELEAYRQVLSKVYDIDMMKVSYDDKSGKIYVETSANNRSPVFAPG